MSAAVKLPARLGIDVWVLDADALKRISARAMQSILTAQEIRQAEQFLFENDAWAFAASRCWLRLILSQALSMRPRDIQFTFGKFGKPYLGTPSNLHFNLSHVSGLTVIAVGAEPLGVDAELLSRWEGFLCRPPYFQPHELQWLRMEADERRVEAGCFLWTAKEAFLKATGVGMRDINEVSVVRGSAETYAYAVAESAGLGVDWKLMPLVLPDGYMGALAIEGVGADIVYRSPAAVGAMLESNELPWLSTPGRKSSAAAIEFLHKY